MLPALTSTTARPLPAPPSLYSKHSWWSDRNSIGATFSLHAATKPFLAYLYHRQVHQLLAERTSMAISDAEMNVLATYLTFQYTSSSTKVFVLQHITANICAYPEASQSVIGALVPSGVLSELLNSERQSLHDAASHLVAQVLGTSSQDDKDDWFPMFSAVGNNTLGSGPHGPRIVSAIHCFLRCTQLALEIDIPSASLCSKSLTDVMVFAHFPDVYEWIVTNIIEPLTDSEEPQGGSSRILAGAWTHIRAQESRFFPPSSRDPRFGESARTIYLGAIKNTKFLRWLTADYPMSEPIEKLTKVASESPSPQIKQWARDVLGELDAGTK
ncbi:Cytochrome P450 [Mycena chlorophos]|uniref:Cytochrome P450 n=1 Tax=Mycena chlorophos TaxID=658473 RepID=A0A8H6RYT8_MYCCL|nr:Cytochrome P450 [Mycena chlorophos]